MFWVSHAPIIRSTQTVGTTTGTSHEFCRCSDKIRLKWVHGQVATSLWTKLRLVLDSIISINGHLIFLPWKENPSYGNNFVGWKISCQDIHIVHLYWCNILSGNVMVVMNIVFWDVVQHYVPESSNIKITAIRTSYLTMPCAVL
jgi:hypothetical protein